MNRKKLKKPVQNESSMEIASENGNESDSDSNSFCGNEEIQATFEGRNPEVSDTSGISKLLQQLFLKSGVECYRLADALVTEGLRGIGATLKQCPETDSDEDDTPTTASTYAAVYGITTALELQSPHKFLCIDSMRTFLTTIIQKHCNEETRNKVKEILENKHVIWVINERFLNIPTKISGFMLKSLYDDMERIKSKSSYPADYIVMLLKIFRPKNNQTLSQAIFANEEEEFFAKVAEVSVEFSVADQTDSGLSGRWKEDDEELIPYRRLILFDASKLKNVIDEIATFVES